MRPIIVSGVVSFLLWSLMLWLSRGFGYEISNADTPTAAYVCLFSLIWVVFAITFWLLRNSAPARRTTWAIVGFGIGFRVLMVFGEPIHENDFYRYLWDGRSTVNGVNPFLYEPAAVWLNEFEIEDLYIEKETGMRFEGRPWSEADDVRLAKLRQLRDENPDSYWRIGHHQIPTIYPPASQAMFAVSAFFFGDSLIGFRLVLLVFDVAAIFLILCLLKQLGRNPAWVIGYAWSPLIVLEFSNRAHLDVMPIAFTLLAIVCVGARRPVSAAAGLVVGVLGKYFSGILFPILFRPNWRGFLVYALCGIAIAAAFLPFVLWQGAGIGRVFHGLGVYTEDWQNHGGVFLIVDKLCGLVLPTAESSYLPAKLVVAILFLGFVAWNAFSPTPDHETLVKKCFRVFAVFFLLNPTAFPWYFAWVVPFLCVFPRPSWIFLMLTLQFYYLGFHGKYAISSAVWLGFPAINWLTWGGFGIVWAIEQGLRWKK